MEKRRILTLFYGIMGLIAIGIFLPMWLIPSYFLFSLLIIIVIIIAEICLRKKEKETLELEE